MENFNSDPKPGRLILPLVLIGMIATTFTFINRVATQNELEIIEENISTDETAVETTEEPSTTSIPNSFTIANSHKLSRIPPSETS